MDRKIIESFIPLDKSWVIRMGIMDITHGYTDINSFLEKEKDLGGDLRALQRIISSWNDTTQPLDVGESGTIYRFARFYLWKNNIQREIKVSDTLVKRIQRGAICDNSDIVNWSPDKLLELDNKTSQWATMSYLLGYRGKVEHPPFKLQVTYDAVKHWENARMLGKVWVARKDPTILNQALAFVDYLETGKIKFSPEQAEDYCFARANNILNEEQGRKLYPSLDGHETPRFEEMAKSLNEVKSKLVTSEDHRVVQAIEMRYFLNGFDRSNFKNPDCVNKTWPQFWKFIDYCHQK